MKLFHPTSYEIVFTFLLSLCMQLEIYLKGSYKNTVVSEKNPGFFSQRVDALKPYSGQLKRTQ